MSRRPVICAMSAALAMSVSMVACQQNALHDPVPVPMYFVEDGAGSVHLVIEPNEVIRNGAGVSVRNMARSVWGGGLANADGSFTSGSFGGEVGDMVLVSADSDSEDWEVCVVVGNFGWQPELCP